MTPRPVGQLRHVSRRPYVYDETDMTQRGSSYCNTTRMDAVRVEVKEPTFENMADLLRAVANEVHSYGHDR